MFKRKKYKTRQSDLIIKEIPDKPPIENQPMEVSSNNNSPMENTVPVEPIENKEDETLKKSMFGLNLFGKKKNKDIKENIKENIKEKVKVKLTEPVEPKQEIKNEIISTILDDDEKLLFSLNALGSLQKDEKLTEKDHLLTVDDRWLFQGLRRWWSEDSRKKSSNKTLIVISTVTERVNKLLENDYLDKIKEENKSKTRSDKLEPPQKKNNLKKIVIIEED